MKYRSMAVQFSVIIFFGLSILLTFQSALIVKRVKSATLQDYSNFCAQIAEEDSGKINYWNQVLLNDLRMYSQSDIAMVGTNQQIIDWIISHDNIRNPLFNYIMFCSPEGVGYTSAGGTVTVISMDFYRELMNTDKKSYVSNIEFQADGSVCYYLARPVFNGKGQKIGVIAGAVKLDEIEKMLKELQLGEAGYALLVGSNGVIISRPQGSEKYFDLYYSDKMGYRGLRELAPQILSGNSGEGYIFIPSGKKEFISYHPVEGTPWTAIIVVPVTQIMKSGNAIGKMITIVSIIIGVLMICFSSSYIIFKLKPIRVVQENIHGIAAGEADLTKHLDIKARNEVGLLADGFNLFVDKLHTIVSEIKTSKEDLIRENDVLQTSTENNSSSITSIVSDLREIESQIQSQSASVSETAGAVEEISQNIVSLENMIMQQSSGVTEASAAVEEMIGNISSVNNSVSYMAESFQNLMKQTRSGISLQTNVNDKILLIEEQSRTLEAANQAISDIAEQTNLLAMNAAIEAAHAGEAGKGFAVVADEIRKLSETSTEQSKTITVELQKVQESIHQVVLASTESTAAFTAMSEDINKTDNLVIQIKNAMEEQQEGSKQIVTALSDMNNTTSEVRCAAKEMSQGNKAIVAEIERLRDTTLVIKKSMDKISGSTDLIKTSSDELSSVSVAVAKSVDGIGSQIDLFKV